ncbi:30S ribosomal protein S16 [Candidatus Magnetaquicoccaceae bacterium FCR-1]|uniref:Small ribosomal subunit protein bS16 n=1 Tax=Candidatus Magnetaquiglobus chichijimensis TaxID=3141448 RepID=A0ABQ0C6T9_9PROT
MAVRIRMQRRGSKKRPFYAVVAADARMPRDGRFLEKLGVFNPLLETDRVSLDMERVNHWLSVGAVPSDTVGRLIKQIQASA